MTQMTLARNWKRTPPKYRKQLRPSVRMIMMPIELGKRWSLEALEKYSPDIFYIFSYTILLIEVLEFYFAYYKILIFVILTVVNSLKESRNFICYIIFGKFSQNPLSR